MTVTLKFDPESPVAKQRYADARRRDGEPGDYVRYQYTGTALKIAVNAALTTSRPLLVRGQPGSGKSTLAYDVAIVLGWRYYERVISSRMSASELLWRFDAVRRLSDGSSGKARRVRKYIEPQTLWRTLAPLSAAMHNKTPPRDDVDQPDDGTEGAVVLIDEIDKADPDLPNDLLGVLGDRRFRVAELGEKGRIEATRKNVLIVITTNGERELPAPFLRRCICVRLETPSPETLRQIANAHMPELTSDERVTGWIDRMRKIADACKSDQHKPGTAEILDAIRACRDLGVVDSEWKALTLAMGWKNADPPPEKL